MAPFLTSVEESRFVLLHNQVYEAHTLLPIGINQLSELPSCTHRLPSSFVLCAHPFQAPLPLQPPFGQSLELLHDAAQFPPSRPPTPSRPPAATIATNPDQPA